MHIVGKRENWKCIEKQIYQIQYASPQMLTTSITQDLNNVFHMLHSNTESSTGW